MIRGLQQADVARVAEIWLDANVRAHHFIPEQYWRDCFGAVKTQLAEAELYVYETAGEIQGFVGLDGSYIAGIFVCPEAQSQGVGKQLLDFIKALKRQLNLSVYQKNSGAVRFYQREGFAVQREGTDEDTGETEYFMAWEQ